MLSAKCDLNLLELPVGFLKNWHAMKGFHENLVGIGPIYNAKYLVLINDKAVTIIRLTGTPVLTGF